MARDVRVENPTRVAIATVEDQNKYLMARNRNIDQVNQYFETNVAADAPVVKKSPLLKLAETLQDSNAILKEYVDKKTAEQNEIDVAQATKFASENPNLPLSEQQKHIMDKSKAYVSTYQTMMGNIYANKDMLELSDEWQKIPEADRLKTDASQWLSSKIVDRNKGMDNPYYIKSYSSNMLKFAEQLQNNSYVEKIKYGRMEYANTAKSNMSVSDGSFLNDINSYEANKQSHLATGLMSAKEYDEMVFNVVQELASTGDVAHVKKVEKFLSLYKQNPKNKDGVPIFGSIARADMESYLTKQMMRAIVEKKNSQDNLIEQKFDEDFSQKKNEAYQLARDGKFAEAQKLLDSVYKPNLDKAAFNEMVSVRRVIDGMEKEAEAEKKRIARGSGSGGGGGGSGDDTIANKKASAILKEKLWAEASNGQLSKGYIYELQQNGKLTSTDAANLIVRIDSFSKEGNSKVNELTQRAMESFRDYVPVPSDMVRNLAARDTENPKKNAIRSSYATDKNRIEREIRQAIEEGKIKTSEEADKLMETLASKLTKKYDNMVDYNPTSQFKSRQEFEAAAAASHNYDAFMASNAGNFGRFRGEIPKPPKNYLEPWQVEMGKIAFRNK